MRSTIRSCPTMTRFTSKSARSSSSDAETSVPGVVSSAISTPRIAACDASTAALDLSGFYLKVRWELRRPQAGEPGVSSC